MLTVADLFTEMPRARIRSEFIPAGGSGITLSTPGEAQIALTSLSVGLCSGFTYGDRLFCSVSEISGIKKLLSSCPA